MSGLPETLTTERAVISSCETYRYWLRRDLAESGIPVCFIMLNPSTADAEIDDPTIRRCMEFARSWGGRELIVVNLFAFRATDPADLKRTSSPIGADNEEAITRALEHCADGIAVGAWGNHGLWKNRGQNVVRRVRAEGRKLHYLKMTGKQQPSHPLYLKADLKPVEWM